MAGPSICLNMIVRNEAHVITQTLDRLRPFIHTWSIVDTGSTDETREIVRTYFARHGIPGELHERPWRNFGANRTEALALARGHADYIWVMDADDLLVGVPDLSALTLDCYHLRLGPDFVYWRPQIFHSRLEWEYRGVVHEYAVCLQAPYTEGRLGGDYHVESRRVGDRNRAADKYQRDCRLLLDALAQAPDDPRTVFYLAQSYFDAGDFRESLRYYTRRAAMPGWAEETYYALFRRAVCLERLGEPWALCQDAYLAAWQFRPARAEPLHRLAERHRSESRHHLAYLYARAASEIPWPEQERLFVAADVYTWRSVDEWAIAAYYTGRDRESIDLATRLLNSADLPEGERERVTVNRDYAVARILTEEVPFPEAIVREIVERRKTGDDRAPAVLTITSCKRPHLLARTVDSFLACCEDVDEIGRWIVVDDGSAPEDRDWIAARYPFFECVWKTADDKGHARSMNMILDRLDRAYWLQLEDDWQFFVRDRYVTKARAILDDDPSLGQVVFNRNYGETIASRNLAGGIVTRTRREGIRYRVHGHVPVETPEYEALMRSLPPGSRHALYWPHYSLQPSLVRVAAIRDVGRFDAGAGHFEREFALRYRDKGYRSAFFDAIHCQHIGRLIADRGPDAPPNAYELNNEAQFVGQAAVRSRSRSVRLAGTGAARALDAWQRQARTGGAWDGIVLAGDGQEADYVAILGAPDGAPVAPGRSIVFPLDPNGDGMPIDRRAFVQIRTHDRYRHVGLWRLDRTWEDLVVRPVEKSRALVAMSATRAKSSGDLLLRRLCRHLAVHGVEAPLCVPGDAAGLLPSRYAIVVEDEWHANYATEAFYDALVAECLCFYWGCPNLEEHVDPSVFVRLPIGDVDASRRLIEDAVGGRLQASRAEVIRREKRRFLNDGQFVPTLARVIRGHERFERLSIKVINPHGRMDRWAAFRAAAFRTTGAFVARCERIPVADGSIRGHTALWKIVAQGEIVTLILEDDVRFEADFLGQIVEVCGSRPNVDVALLGNGGYLLSPAGARYLLALADRDGIQDGIDELVMRHAGRLNVVRAVPPLLAPSLATASMDPATPGR